MFRSSAELLYDKLSGIACLFKPADMQIQHFFTIIQERLATGIWFWIKWNNKRDEYYLAFNQMSYRPPMQRVDIIRDQQTGKEMVVSSVDLSDTIQGWERFWGLFEKYLLIDIIF